MRGENHEVLFRQAPLPREALCRAAGLEGAALHLARQVHGAAVAEFPAAEADGRGDVRPEADALVTRVAGHVVGVATADCLPILLAGKDGRCAAVHAGWKGLLSGVIEAAVARLRAAGAPPSSKAHREEAASGYLHAEPVGGVAEPELFLEAAIGPAIGPCCFEVGPEVADRFLARFPSAGGCLRPASEPGKSLVDLASAAVHALEECGLPRDNVRLIPLCTRCGSESLESYRRDGEKAGRMIAMIGPRP
jgi:hypothetical protein